MSRAPRALRPSPALKLELLRYTLWRQRDIHPHRSRTWHTCPASRLSRYSSSNRTTSEYGASRHFSAALEGLTILFFKHASYITPKEPRLLRLWRSGQQLHMMTRGLGGYVERAKLELIAPMMLQIWRLVFIRGSRFTTTMAVLYWVDWATVQYCHCWIYFRHTKEEKSHCLHAIQHAKEERSICKRDCATQGEANDYIDILTRLWGTRWTLRLMLDLLILTCLGPFLLGGLVNSIPLAILGTLLCFYYATVLGTEAI